MTILHRYFAIRRPVVVLAGSLALTLAVTVKAQQSVPSAPEAPVATVAPDIFSFEIGHAARANAVYSITATQPATSKLTGQKIRLKVVETSGADTTTRYFSFATGKHKTVLQMDSILSEAFHRFLSNPPPAASEQELARIGDVRYGGEVRIIAEPSGQLRFDNVTPGEPVRPTYYSRTDVEAWQAALTGQPPA